MKKLLLLINPSAGRMTGKHVVFDLVDRADFAGYCVEVKPTRDAENIKKYLVKYGEDFDLIICCGGDGTLNATISGLMRLKKKPNLGYIPAGSTNDFAKTLNLSKDPVVAIYNILKGKKYKIDVGSFNDSYFTYIAAFGAFTEISYQTPQNLKNAIGHAAYILNGIKALPDIRPQRVKIICDAGTFEDDYLYGSISNSTSVAGLVKLDEKKVDLSDGKFELMLIKNPHDILQLGQIIDDLLSQKYASPFVKFVSIKEAIIETPDGVAWTLDGEDGQVQTRVKIRVLCQMLG